MCMRQIAAGVVIAMLGVFTILPAGAWAADTRIQGVIVSLDQAGGGFVLRTQSRVNEDQIVVRITARTRVHLASLADEGEDTSHELSVGDIVSVEGRVRGDGQVVARDIQIIARADSSSPRWSWGGNFPPFFRPSPKPLTAPEIFTPASGDGVDAEFAVVGRTLPGAVVHVDVQLVVFVARFQVAASDVTANRNGFFVLTVRPVTQYRGASYHVTVLASAQGRTTPQASIDVWRQ